MCLFWNWLHIHYSVNMGTHQLVCWLGLQSQRPIFAASCVARISKQRILEILVKPSCSFHRWLYAHNWRKCLKVIEMQTKLPERDWWKELGATNVKLRNFQHLCLQSHFTTLCLKMCRELKVMASNCLFCANTRKYLTAIMNDKERQNKEIIHIMQVVN